MQEQNICMDNSNKQPFPWAKPPLEEELELLGLPRSAFPLYFDVIPPDVKLFDFPSLKRTWIEKAVANLYMKSPLPAKPKVTLFTWVMGDGLGDFSAQIEAAHSLIPLPIDLSLISLHPTRMPLHNPHLPCPHYFSSYEEDEKGTWSHIPAVYIPTNIKNVFSSSDVLLQMPTYFPYTNEILSFLKQGTSYELIGEGGWGSTPYFCPKSGFRSMGLFPWEKGLFFPRDPLKNSPIQNRPLAQVLEKKSLSKLYFAYLRNPSCCLLFLQTTLLLEKNNKQPICLCVFPSENLIEKLPYLTSFLIECGIQSIEIYYKNSFCSIPVQTEGKTLTLVETTKLPREDYQSLLMRASSLVGCRGDGSLSETLLAEKIPFFDFPPHKMPLLEGLFSLASHSLSSSHPTTCYIKTFLTKDPDPLILSKLLANPSLAKGFATLFSLLQSYYNMTDFAPPLIMRAAYHHFYPWIAMREKSLLDSFFFDEKNPFLVLRELKNMITG